MLVIVGFVSQKGGVGKSALARALATVAAEAGIKVKIADLDPQQQTVKRWEERREANYAGPSVHVESVRTLADAIDETAQNQLVIIDSPARAGKATSEVARRADVVVQPSGASIDDLDPAIILFHELVRVGVPRDRLVMALCRIANDSEERAARAYVEKAGYAVLPGSIPERAVYREAHNRGQALTEIEHNGARARVDALLERLLAMVSERVRKRMKVTASPGKKTRRAT
jgi:chromosome partitioning protein